MTVKTSESKCLDYLLSDFANHAGTVANIKTSPDVDKMYTFLLVSGTFSGQKDAILRPRDNFAKELLKKGYNGSYVLSPLGPVMKKDICQLFKAKVIDGIVIYEANFHLETNLTTPLFEDRFEIEETPCYEQKYSLYRWGKPMLKLDSFCYTLRGGERVPVSDFEGKVKRFLDDFFPICVEPNEGNKRKEYAIEVRGIGTGLVRRCLDNFRHYYNPVEYPFVFGCH